MGRLTRDPDIRFTQGKKQMCIARYILAVPRKFKQQDGQEADFISCIAFGKNGEFADKYLKQGIKIIIAGRIQTGSYEKKDGTKVFTTEIVVEEQEFAESKSANETLTTPSHPQEEPQQMSLPLEEQKPTGPKAPANEQPWMAIPDGYESELPFV